MSHLSHIVKTLN